MDLRTISDQDFNLLERYFDGELSELEMQQFEKRIKSDETFRNQFDLRTRLPDIYKEARKLQEIKRITAETIGRIQNEKKGLVTDRSKPDHETLKKKFFFKRFFAMAASVLVLAGLYSVFVIMKEKNTDQPFTETKIKINSSGQAPYKGDSGVLISKNTHRKIVVPGQHVSVLMSDTVIFRWNRNDGRHPISMEINKSGFNTVVFKRIILPGTDSLVLFPGILKPGSYVWQTGQPEIKGTFTIRTSESEP
jgi:hypothetical protein